MYINGTERYYTRDGQQACSRAPFLLLIQLTDRPLSEIYGIVRKVALKQCGHWMMGKVRIGGASYSVSGSYGNDGLPITVKALPKDAVRLPNTLYEQWVTGGGWNCAGAEGPAMREWGRSIRNAKVQRV